jgi:hypothetical protein
MEDVQKKMLKHMLLDFRDSRKWRLKLLNDVTKYKERSSLKENVKTH